MDYQEIRIICGRCLRPAASKSALYGCLKLTRLSYRLLHGRTNPTASCGVPGLWGTRAEANQFGGFGIMAYNMRHSWQTINRMKHYADFKRY